MRKIIGSVAIVAGLLGAYALLDGAAAPPAKGPQNTAAQAVRKAAAHNPADALSQAQSHAAVAYRAALARDGKTTGKQLGEVLADLDAARPALARLDGALAGELTAIRSAVERLKKRSGTDTGALVPEIAKAFKGMKQLQAEVDAYSATAESGPSRTQGQSQAPGKPQPFGKPGKSGQAAQAPHQR